MDVDPGPPPGSEAGPPTDPDAGPDASRDASTDAGTDAGSDAGADAHADVVPDAGFPSIKQTVDQKAAELTLDGATLTIGAGTFRGSTLVTLLELPGIDHAGAYGPVFEISVPSAGLFQQVAKLTLPVPSIGANQANLVLGAFDPSLPLAAQLWNPVSDSTLSSDQTSVTGSVTGFGNASALQYAVVLRCTLTSQCRSGEACNSGACQQCPTSSVCAP